MKEYYAKDFFENLSRVVFPNCLRYICVNDAYSDFLYRFVEAINFIAPNKKDHSEGKLKPLIWQPNYVSNKKTT